METRLAKIQETLPTVASTDVKRELYLGRKPEFHLFHDWWPFENAQFPQSRVIPLFRSGIQMGRLLPALVHLHIQLCDPFRSRSWVLAAVLCVVCLVPEYQQPLTYHICFLGRPRRSQRDSAGT